MKIYSATLCGVTPIPVEIEIDLSSGLPFFQIVGLPDAVLRESKTRVKSAIIQSDFDFPYDSRLVLNLSPSKVRKEGSAFELALAARILCSSGQVGDPGGSVMFLGELSLDGSVRNVDDLQALAYASEGVSDLRLLVVPMEEVELVSRHAPCPVVGIHHLKELVGSWWVTQMPLKSADGSEICNSHLSESHHLISTTGVSSFWARHLEIATVGRHSYLLCGPPGTGKTFFAETLKLFVSVQKSEKAPGLRALDALFGRKEGEIPWAAPHHSATNAGMLGGGGNPRPGAVTRAHGGILFLDELLEFSPAVIDGLREPIEKKSVEIHRAGVALTFPGDFQLIAATNPCRCGLWGHPTKNCTCLKPHRKMYQNRMSGPFFDRFDVRVFCPPYMGDEVTVPGKVVLNRIQKALMLKRRLMAENRLAEMENHAKKYWAGRLARRVESRRSYEKIHRLAVTLAMLDLRTKVEFSDLQEACDYQIIEGLESLC